MKPDFRDINITGTPKPCCSAAESGTEIGSENIWITPELIPVKSVYTREDVKGLGHLNYAAGIAPVSYTHLTLPTIYSV